METQISTSLIHNTSRNLIFTIFYGISKYYGMAFAICYGRSKYIIFPHSKIVFIVNSGWSKTDMEVDRFAILSESGRTANRMMLGYLRDSGFHVDIFHDQSSALNSINKCSYTLLLVDIDMPGLDVLSFLSHTHNICIETSIVIITDNEKMDDAMKALKQGAADILVKPIDLFYLDAVLEKSIRLSKLVVDHARVIEDMSQAQSDLAELKHQNLRLRKENESLRIEIQHTK